MRHNQDMLSMSIYNQVSKLVSQVHQLLEGVNAGLAYTEVNLRAEAINQTLTDLQQMISFDTPESNWLRRGSPFEEMNRHLYWLCRNYREGKPDKYAPDIRDIREHDLPGVIRAVSKWGSELLDPRLASAIGVSWDAQRYSNAVLDAFICLENVLRDLGEVEATRGLSGDRLVTSLLEPSSKARIELPANTFLGPLTSGETSGFYNLVKGAFLLFRNAMAHRPIASTAREAEDIISLINLCMLFLPNPTQGRR
jgi:hypothetical protein